MIDMAAPSTVARVYPGPPAGALTLGEDDDEVAIRRELMQQFMRDARLRMWMSLVSTFAIAAMAWNYADRASVLAWLGAGVAVFIGFWILERPYQQGRSLATAQDQERMVRLLAPLYVARGLYWGTPLLLFFMVDSVPRTVQTGCAIVGLAMTSDPLTSMALVPRLCRRYTHALFGTAILCFAWRVIERHGPQLDLTSLFVVIPFFHWALMLRLSERVYLSHRKMCALQCELVRKEREAKLAIDAKNRMLAAAAHDMRQPVSALSLLAHHLVLHPDTHLQLAPKIAAASASINQLFDALFEHSALESGAVSVVMQDIDLSLLLGSLEAEYGALARARRLELHVRAPRLGARTDPMRLRRIIANLLSNAMKYSAPERRILLAARMRRGRPCVQVWDQGIGIASGELDKIFQEFYRVNLVGAPPEVRDRVSAEGIGLGLSIVARLSRLLHVGIEVASTPGRGTCITLVLPAPVEPGPGA